MTCSRSTITGTTKNEQNGCSLWGGRFVHIKFLFLYPELGDSDCIEMRFGVKYKKQTEERDGS